MKDKYQVPALSSASTTETPIARRKLSHEVLDRLLPRIRSGEFAVGSLLPSERELMVTLGVGRPAVREALQTLERMGLVARLRVGLGRLVEADDDELAYAFFAANAAPDAVYERRRWSSAYFARAYALYRPSHVARGVAMASGALGFPPVIASRAASKAAS